jgi:uncharacterized repeat protein (TIGR03803 family)
VTTVHAFCAEAGCGDGQYPWGGLIQDYKGNIYGVASSGGAHGPFGTVFQLQPSGQVKAIYSFCALTDCGDGFYPYSSLVLGPGGDLYGLTQSGGAHGNGTVFQLTTSGSLTTLYNFCAQSGCADGALASAILIGSDGNFYGTTRQGGAKNLGVFFKLTPAGQFTVLYNFCSQPDCADGGAPFWLIQANDRNFYGLTRKANGPGTGTLFEMTPSGSLTVLHTFCATGTCTDGNMPSSSAGLFQATNGIFYGVVGHGGNVTSGGTVFSLATGLPPFVITAPGSGLAGAAVQILGANLTGATSVTFNGTAAAFHLVSSTEVIATVPAGATSGPVRVVTPGGTLSSNISFTVVP